MLPMALVLCLGALTTLVSGLPFKVPKAACEDMSPQGPGHGFASPQSSPVPYEFTLDRTKISSSDKVELTIKSKDDLTFSGFMVQARDDKSATPLHPLGTFQPKDSNNAQAVECSAENDTGSHNNPDPKKTVTLIWTHPSNFKGQATFYVTVAQTRFKFWVHEKAGTVDVE